MLNQELAQIFYEISQYLEMEDVAFKPQAYEKAGLTLEGLSEDVKEIYQKGGIEALEELPAVGKGIAEKIVEYIKTGRIKEYQKLKKKMPMKLDELTRVEGLGPRKVKVLYQKLGIRNVKDLEKAAKANKIAPLFGFGEKTEKNILEGLAFLKRSKGRFLLGNTWPVIKEVYAKLKNLSEVKEISLAGSVRRQKETIGDVDFLVISQKPEKVMKFFCSLLGVVKIWSQGTTKSSVRMRQGFDMDIRVVPQKSYGSALQYFTGSKEHNIVLRRMAQDKHYKLNEYGIFRGKKYLAGKTEKEVYEAIGLPYIEPELRENQGEIEAALKQSQGKPDGLPNLVDYKDIKGDLHCHSDWDGGENSLEEIAETAQKMGYQYLGIADHTKFLRIEHGLDEKQLLQQKKAIKKINAKLKNFRILQGCETNIMADGSVDIKDEILSQLDYVIAGVHSQFKMPKEKMTQRIIKAMQNPHIDIISHPTGRILQRRDEYAIDFEQILKAAKATGTILEINAFPARLDLKDTNIKKAREAGVKMVINTDAHQKDQLDFMEYGISQARRGWAEKKDIINTMSYGDLVKFLRKG